ncbi:hypothetical protein, partial [Caballeronia grimmiae]|uniref:hypothetical protein n=1 Tax=Caballeronia grimmiae TaxID=1071679 RepID=UPI0019D354A9
MTTILTDTVLFIGSPRMASARRARVTSVCSAISLTSVSYGCARRSRDSTPTPEFARLVAFRRNSRMYSSGSKRMPVIGASVGDAPNQLDQPSC